MVREKEEKKNKVTYNYEIKINIQNNVKPNKPKKILHQKIKMPNFESDHIYLQVEED